MTTHGAMSLPCPLIDLVSSSPMCVRFVAVNNHYCPPPRAIPSPIPFAVSRPSPIDRRETRRHHYSHIPTINDYYQLPILSLRSPASVPSPVPSVSPPLRGVYTSVAVLCVISCCCSISRCRCLSPALSLSTCFISAVSCFSGGTVCYPSPRCALAVTGNREPTLDSPLRLCPSHRKSTIENQQSKRRIIKKKM